MTIEPTEEQRRAAVMHRYKLAVLPDKGYLTDWVRTGDASGRAAFDEVVALARLLAEREAKLRAELHTERTVAEKALAARNDMENERDAARRDLARANGYLLAGQKSEMAMKGQLAEARARVAELGQAAGEVNDALGVLDLCMVVPLVRGLEARAAQHLADIKALRHLLQVMRATRSVRQNSSLAVLRAAIDAALVDTAHYDETNE